MLSLSTACTSRWMFSRWVLPSRRTSEYLCNTSSASLSWNGSRATAPRTAPSSAAPRTSSSSGMASAARNAQSRNTSAAAGLLHVRACLDDGQRQPIHFPRDAFSSSTVHSLRLLEGGIQVQSFAPAQQKQRALLQRQLFHFDAGSERTSRFTARREQDIAFVACGQELLSQGQVVSIVQAE